MARSVEISGTEVREVLNKIYLSLEAIRTSKNIKTAQIAERLNVGGYDIYKLRGKMKKGNVDIELRSLLSYIQGLYQVAKMDQDEVIYIPITTKELSIEELRTELTFKEIILRRKKIYKIKPFCEKIGCLDSTLYSKESNWLNMTGYPTFASFIRYCSGMGVDSVKFSFKDVDKLRDKLSRRWTENKEERVKKCSGGRRAETQKQS